MTQVKCSIFWKIGWRFSRIVSNVDLVYIWMHYPCIRLKDCLHFSSVFAPHCFSIVWLLLSALYLHITTNYCADFINVTLIGVSDTSSCCCFLQNQQHSHSRWEKVQTLAYSSVWKWRVFMCMNKEAKYIYRKILFNKIEITSEILGHI